MGGRIWVESQVGVGSAFHFTVILESSAEHLPAKDLEQERPQDEVLKGLRILIVDDNELNRDVACMMLEQDHLVTTANNGREALAALAIEDFDAILMDVQMPEMDGLAATAIIRALEEGRPLPGGLSEAQSTFLAEKIKGRHLPIIAMTAHAMSEDQQRCLTAGMDEYISKPFQYDRLVSVLRTLIPVSLRADTQPVGISAKNTSSPPLTELVARYLQSTTHLTDEKIANLLSAARKNLVDLLGNAEKALLEKDYNTFKLTAHSLKGTLLQCGLVDAACAG
jgi:CheY-like chemotaxis protein